MTTIPTTRFHDAYYEGSFLEVSNVGPGEPGIVKLAIHSIPRAENIGMAGYGSHYYPNGSDAWATLHPHAIPGLYASLHDCGDIGDLYTHFKGCPNYQPSYREEVAAHSEPMISDSLSVSWDYTLDQQCELDDRRADPYRSIVSVGFGSTLAPRHIGVNLKPSDAIRLGCLLVDVL
ncbi:MAG: hypothetical protein TQ37_08365 [Candidatus Synechococcus spongiarum 15L]|nr:hypothetical protein [Candidatus Synechococcus spongiarum]KKZ10729.1 MAG: hypothetical protein TQ37_08365 [Candidatus Synechococcus spongiarum 15L]